MELTFEQVARDLIESRRAAGTRKIYHYDLAAWLAHCELDSVNPADPPQGAANAFRAALEAKQAPLTVRRRLAALSKMYRAAVAKRVATWNPFDPETLPRPPADVYSRTEAFSDIEVARIFAAAEKEGTPLARRDLALFRLMYDTGLRVGSACALERSKMFDRGGGTFVRVKVKGGKWREVQLPAPTARAIDRWLEVAPESDYVFPAKTPDSALGSKTVNKRLADYGRALGIKKAHPHRFRAAFATAALDAGVPLHEVQAAMHHESSQTTQRYDRGVRGTGVADAVAAFREKKGAPK